MQTVLVRAIRTESGSNHVPSAVFGEICHL